MLKYLNYLGDIADLIEDSVEVLQQLRYGNETEARVKLLKISTASVRIYNEMNGVYLTADSEGDSDP